MDSIAARGASAPQANLDEGRNLRLAGALLVGGLVFFYIVTPLWHPGGQENNHPVIFTKYAKSDAWIAVHLLQFAAVLVQLAGFLVLYRLLAVRREVLARCALGASIAAAATYAALQAVDGVALKHAVDAWVAASGPEKAIRFADAEIVRWTEWGFNGYFRLLLGLAFVLFGVAIAVTGLVYRWLGLVSILAGLAYASVGVAVAYSGFEQPAALVEPLLHLAFGVGVLVAGLRRHDRADVASEGAPTPA
jgi:hypothetical protein